MTSILDHYKVLGVSVGAGIADITSSYKRLCRTYHPDLNDDPASEELMKRINIAYAVLREKLAREAIFRERQIYQRPVRRYQNPDFRSRGTDTHTGDPEHRGTGTDGTEPGAAGINGADARGTATRADSGTATRADSDAAEKEARSALNSYFRMICECDYKGAYKLLSSYDKKQISQESFIRWRKSVARLFTMRGYEITGGLPPAAVSFSDDRILRARRFGIAVTEENNAEETTQTGSVEKLVINENGVWKVFLGYKGVGDLTRAFDEKFEAKKKRDITKLWEECYTGQAHEYNMLSLRGLRKPLSREIYRQSRFGGSITFAALSVKAGGDGEAGQEQLLRAAAKTIAASLRETDIPAYAGDGVFAILFVELHEKNVGEIIVRLTKKIRGRAGARLGMLAEIDYAFVSWPGDSPAGMDAVNNILRKFNKKV